MPGAALRFIARLCRSEAAAGELTRSVGIRMAPTCPAVCAPGSESAPLAGSCGRVTCRLQAAARHLPKRQRSWLDTAAPAPQAPCTHRPSLFSSFPPRPVSLPPHFLPPSSLLLLLYPVFSFSESRHQALQVGGGSFPPHELFLCLVVAIVATARRSSSPSSRAPPPPPRTASTGVMHKLPAGDPNLPGF